MESFIFSHRPPGRSERERCFEEAIRAGRIVLARHAERGGISEKAAVAALIEIFNDWELLLALDKRERPRRPRPHDLDLE
jgi:hypothetical protein